MALREIIILGQREERERERDLEIIRTSIGGDSGGD
jgi:hypothetical protein